MWLFVEECRTCWRSQRDKVDGTDWASKARWPSAYSATPNRSPASLNQWIASRWESCPKAMTGHGNDEQESKEASRFHVLKIEPTPERIMKLPAWAQQYIFDLEVRADPAGDIRDLAAARGERDALIRKITELKHEINRLQRALRKQNSRR